MASCMSSRTGSSAPFSEDLDFTAERRVPEAETLRRRLAAQFADAGLVVVDSGADANLHVSRMRRSGEKRSYLVHGMGALEQKAVAVTIVEDTVAWLDASGKTLWKTGHVHTNDPGFGFMLRDDQSIDEYMAQLLPKDVAVGDVPLHIMPPVEETILGESRLTPTGVK